MINFHYMRAWIRVLDVPGCYERAARFERPAKQALAVATEPRAKREVRSVLYH